MTSVTVVWKGSRSDPRIRYRLLSYLDRLAARSNEYFKRTEPKQPARLKALNKQNGNATRLRPNVELFDEENGRLDPDLELDQPKPRHPRR